ncbi:MAG: matrixin family metalloprotease [Candidatus Roizmanbacteria bacterium]|nr:MAG: matrixin family metalloprotease [Candidatus Roizmanbacteria bacterium]
MKKLTLLTLVIISAFVFVVSFSTQSQAQKNSSSSSSRTFQLPNSAVKIDENIYKLGKAKDKDGKEVEGYAIIHYKNKGAKNGSAKGVRNQCYGFLAEGAKWKSVEPWIVNPANIRGITDSFAFNNLTANIAKWEDAADGVLSNGSGVDILGDGSITSSFLEADTVSPDGANEIYFANVTDSSAIAVTIVWGVFGGPRTQRVLVEWDQVYDDVDYNWSETGEADKMDFENIATHELGHSVGLNDLYTSNCSQETMYGYASNGETSKRDLNAGDIKGISTLY